MTRNRFKGFWQQDDDEGQEFIFDDDPAPGKDSSVERTFRAPAENDLFQQSVSPPGQLEDVLELVAEPLRRLVGQCHDLVERDPEVARQLLPFGWDLWFKEPLLSTVRTSILPLDLKLRALAFFAVMLPFLDTTERDRVRRSLETISRPGHGSPEDVLTRQDLLHTEWLVRSIVRSGDVQNQLKALERSIVRRLPRQHAQAA